MTQKRPMYVVQVPTGVMVAGEGNELVEAVVLIDIKQTRDAAERIASGHDGAEVVKRFLR